MTKAQRRAGHRAAAQAFVVLGALLGALAGAAGSADAARLGPLTSGTLLGQSVRYGALTATFDTSATSLTGTATNCSNTWTVGTGTMRVSSGAASSTTSSGLATATVPLCFSSGPHAEAGGDLRPNSGVNFGVLVHAATGGRPSTAAIYDSSAAVVRLQRISSTGSTTTWATMANVPSGSAVRHLRLWYVDGVYTVVMNGASLTFPLTNATTRSTVEANGAVGIVAVSDTRTTFDNFQGYPR